MTGRAVVVGGGMGGLVTAEVLSKHFSEVVLLERDQPQGLWEENAVAMAGVSVRITHSLALRLLMHFPDVSCCPRATCCMWL